jgi:hypothetical protein
VFFILRKKKFFIKLYINNSFAYISCSSANGVHLKKKVISENFLDKILFF